MSSKQAEASKARDAAWTVFAGVATGAVALMVAAFLVLRFLVDTEGWGTFGEVYGAVVGSFFAAMAFSGVILTVHLQRIEMRASTEELRRAAEAQEASEKAQARRAKSAQQESRLNAAMALLEHYDRTRARFDGHAFYTKEVREADSDVAAARAHLENIVIEIEAEVKAEQDI